MTETEIRNLYIPELVISWTNDCLFSFQHYLGIKISAQAKAYELKVNLMQTSQPSTDIEKLQRKASEVQFNRENIKLHHQYINDLLKQFESATPDRRFEMMEEGVLPDSQLFPPAVPVRMSFYSVGKHVCHMVYQSIFHSGVIHYQMAVCIVIIMCLYRKWKGLL